jgi:hypothetical protein
MFVHVSSGVSEKKGVSTVGRADEWKHKTADVKKRGVL